MELTSHLAAHLVHTTYEDLPVEVIEATKRSVLDTLGVMLPPTTVVKACAVLYDLVKEEGDGQCTLVGFGGKAPCVMAAFLNGAIAHPMDYDDTVDASSAHLTASSLPAALAMAEKIGGVDGKKFITAIALGNDLKARLALAPRGRVVEDYPWFHNTTMGVFAATAAAGTIIGLSRDEMVNALGIALNGAFGIQKVIHDPDSDMRAIRDGFNAKEGVLAALMAKRGVAANKNGIENLYEFFYRNDYDPKVIVEGLGKEFGGTTVSLKPWPSCRATHGFIQAALDIVKEVDHKDIEEVTVRVGKWGGDFLCEPVERKRNPLSSMEAKLSLPYVLGIALSKKKVVIADFLLGNLGNPDAMRIAKRVRYQVDPGFRVIAPAVLEVRAKGTSRSLRVDIVYGHPQNPMSESDSVTKFKDCARYAKKPLSEDTLNQIIEGIGNLEAVKDIAEITALFA